MRGSGVQSQRFSTTVRDGGRGRVFVPTPFDPDSVWQPKQQHHVTGTINGMGLRAVIERHSDSIGFTLGPAWLADCGLDVGEQVEVIVVPEGPQRGDLAPDIAAALDANARAGAFFDSLAQFYRRAYLRWIDATKRRPDLRAKRIAVVVDLLAAGIKERPKE